MKKILLSIGSIVFAGALVAGGTGALLVQNQSSTGNTFSSGIVNIKIDNESYITSTTTGKLIASPSTSWALGDLAGKLFVELEGIAQAQIHGRCVDVHEYQAHRHAREWAGYVGGCR